ncbi:hypothetical protein [Yersinia aleksiciae]|uniref:Uncharacterized protein n=1 Tax=Yersinia aleksiciae TaxID=263819 RepID=A0A0T9UXE3_YERAE|nr:hypothetical protein [Yersinia aleksiciae]MDA5497736.1 hypothetical protein [Yersinia aleksiciae]NIL00820.1 hypothetical protein [Yersinia aleksiciae]WQC70094.1 hypothetical protein N0K21_15835 [Yersinia aleksiciae]CNL80413.1 Uncharacterised protein [Yersinia aleksiciae]
MNYQSSNMLVYSARFAIIAAICLLVSFFGLNVAIFYVLILGLVYGLWVSLSLHRLAEKGFVYLIAEKTQWTVYVQGIPVRETRSSLKNPCFISVARLVSFFSRFLIIKVLIQAALVYLALQQTFHLSLTLNPYLLMALRAIGVVIICILIYKVWLSMKTLLALRRSEWLFEEVPRDGFSYYQAYIIKHDKKSGNQLLQPALAELLAL